MTRVWRNRLSWSGIFISAAAWAISLQTNYAVAPKACDIGAFVLSLIAAALVLVAIAGAVLSFLSTRASPAAEWTDSTGGRTRRFVAWVGVGTGTVFALAIANQFAATLIVHGCLR
jgi:hypothetical protein